MPHRRLLISSLVTFLALSIVATVGRMAVYDTGCHQASETLLIGNVNATVEPCSGTYVHTYSLGIPGFYSFPHEGEFGTVPSTFHLGALLINIIWIGVVSFLIGLFIASRTAKSVPTPTSAPSKL